MEEGMSATSAWTWQHRRENLCHFRDLVTNFACNNLANINANLERVYCPQFAAACGAIAISFLFYLSKNAKIKD